MKFTDWIGRYPELITGVGMLLMISLYEGGHALFTKNEVRIEISDFNGDGILDKMEYRKGYDFDWNDDIRRYLYLGQGNSEYIKAKEVKDWGTGVRYFMAQNEEVYFFDGKQYRLSPQNIP